MAYEKNTWETGDLIVADLMNHIEDGIADATNTAEEALEKIDDIDWEDTPIGQDVNALEKASNLTVMAGTSDVALNVQTGGYYSLTGQFVSETGRQYAIIDNVMPGDVYLLTSKTSSTLIAAVLYLDQNGTVISYDYRGTGENKILTDVEVTIPEGCTKLIIQCSTNYQVTFGLKKTFIETKGVRYIDTETLDLGEDILAYVFGYYAENTNWSGDKETGYTHTAGKSDSLSFSTNDIVEGAIYICEFDTSYTQDEFVNVGIGSQYRIPVYTGTTHITIPLLAVGTKALYFTPLNNRTFTISNITMRQVGGTDINKTLSLYNVLTDNHTNNLGYWNVLLGKLTAENAVGATRTLAIGYAALNSLTGGHRNIALGTFAMSQMVSGENNIAIGADSMFAIQSALNCVTIGKGAMYNGTLVEDNIAIGANALTGSASSGNSKRNVAIGKNAGWYAYGQDNIFIGYQAGYSCLNTNGNTCIGKNALGPASGNHNTSIGEESTIANNSTNATAIGYHAEVTKSNQVVIGNANITEVVIGGKKIIFNNDGTVTWEAVV